MTKQLAFDGDAQAALCRGVEQVARAVRATLGPRGRAVILESRFGAPTIAFDGVTVARAIELEDRIENLGAQLLREVSVQTQAAAGDGTTTATVLAQALVVEGIRHIAAGVHPQRFRRGIDRAVAAACEALHAQSRPVGDEQEIAQVARLAGGGERRIGELVAAAFARIGRSGAVSIERARGLETTLAVVEGMELEGGYLSPYFVTDAERLEAVLEEPLVLVHAQSIARFEHLLPVLEQVSRSRRSLLVVAGDVEGEALATLVVNALRGNLRVAAVKAPQRAARRRAALSDLAAVCGARLLDERAGDRLELVTLAELGSARRVVAGRDATLVAGGGGDPEALAARRRALAGRLAAAGSELDRRQLEARRGRLGDGVAVIRVGAPTEVALVERRARFEDAVSATRAALAEGIVPGGGTSLVHAAGRLAALAAGGDEALGVASVGRALLEPLRRLALNAGADGAAVIEEVRRRGGTWGFNALSGRFEDLLVAGIIDPTLVVRTALQKAASIGGLLLTTQAVVAERPDSGEDERA